MRPYGDDELRDLHNEQANFRHEWIRAGRPRGSTFQSYVKYKQAKRKFVTQLKAKQLRFFQFQYEELENSLVGGEVGGGVICCN